jgi:hypothetical protein
VRSSAKRRDRLAPWDVPPVIVLALALFGLSSPPAPLHAQQRTVLQGLVADEVTGLIIPSARVNIVGTRLETSSSAEGLFSFPDAPAGRLSVRVRAAGYATVVHIVDVVADSAHFIQVDLPSMAMMLEGLTVVAPGSGPNRDPAARTAADLVARQVPGMNANSGVVGLSSNPVLLRGVNSIGLSSEAAIFLDGVRLRGGRGQAMDALSKIPASDVKSIRILRGPAATLVDGSANGVIYVETRFGPGE